MELTLIINFTEQYDKDPLHCDQKSSFRSTSNNNQQVLCHYHTQGSREKSYIRMSEHIKLRLGVEIIARIQFQPIPQINLNGRTSHGNFEFTLTKTTKKREYRVI